MNPAAPFQHQSGAENVTAAKNELDNNYVDASDGIIKMEIIKKEINNLIEGNVDNLDAAQILLP